MTRRKFVKMAGSALTLANIPLAARALYAENEPPPSSFGGPTPNDKFYLTSFGSTPRVDATKWSLKIHGLVREPITAPGVESSIAAHSRALARVSADIATAIRAP